MSPIKPDLNCSLLDSRRGFYKHEILAAIAKHQSARHGNYAISRGQDQSDIARHAIPHSRLGIREMQRDQVGWRTVNLGFRAVDRRDGRRKHRTGAEGVQGNIRRIAHFELGHVRFGDVSLDFYPAVVDKRQHLGARRDHLPDLRRKVLHRTGEGSDQGGIAQSDFGRGHGGHCLRHDRLLRLNFLRRRARLGEIKLRLRLRDASVFRKLSAAGHC